MRRILDKVDQVNERPQGMAHVVGSMTCMRVLRGPIISAITRGV